ncbi:hypothetical protein SLS60_009857 [Paraconiothyrium brasiliense]|uniref:Uncharacterized protein n=1 Tax=Paraconiothyrium brasiliense TaxID=300254 RepID=A0ABR3QTF1_9PLEO
MSCVCILISAFRGNHLDALLIGIVLAAFLFFQRGVNPLELEFNSDAPAEESLPDSETPAEESFPGSDPPAEASRPDYGPAMEDPGSSFVGFPKGITVPDESDGEKDSGSTFVGFPKGITVPDESDDEQDSENPGAKQDESSVGTRTGTLTNRRENLAEPLDEWKRRYFDLESTYRDHEAEYKFVLSQNVELNRRINIYERGDAVQNALDKLETAKFDIQSRDCQIEDLEYQVRRLQDRVDRRVECYEENAKLKAEQDEMKMSLARVSQVAEEKSSAFDKVVKILHEMVEKNGSSVEPVVWIMYQLIRSGINIQHLAVDLDKFFWYLKYVQPGNAQHGTIHGGFRASMSMYLGGDSRGSVFIKGHDGAEHHLPLQPVTHRDLEQVCGIPCVPFNTATTGTNLPPSLVQLPPTTVASQPPVPPQNNTPALNQSGNTTVANGLKRENTPPLPFNIAQLDDRLQAALDMVAAKQANAELVEVMLAVRLNFFDKHTVENVRSGQLDVSTACRVLSHLRPEPKANPGAAANVGATSLSAPTPSTTTTTSPVPFPNVQPQAKPQPASDGDSVVQVGPDSTLNGGGADFRPGQSSSPGGALHTATKSSAPRKPFVLGDALPTVDFKKSRRHRRRW